MTQKIFIQRAKISGAIQDFRQNCGRNVESF